MSRVAAIILAAGTASRYREEDPAATTKLVALLDGRALVRHVADAACASRARPVVVVTGHARADVETALAGLDVHFVHNDDYADGIAGSVRCGLAALEAGSTGAVVLLADMPRVQAQTIDALIDAAAADPDCDAVLPVHDGRRGNPVLLMRSLFAPAMRLTGDEGARRLLADPSRRIVEIEAGENVALDIDTPQALLQAARKR